MPYYWFALAVVEALQVLNESLPVWMENAMHEYPWTVVVNIIYGGGNQIISESVEHWIRKTK